MMKLFSVVFFTVLLTAVTGGAKHKEPQKRYSYSRKRFLVSPYQNNPIISII